ncbi:hypothetical protein BGW38_002154 [Lunasporangiospora selenospora]|uniref:Tail specific protease domain-containing protein n=1 Tax=Lunasporangiospora selenospora TaxID=979761 RepID=A0A9P6KDR8_9FUNG|nr:hypothetical protein BGW38_002154 [Lunasporangiospora selenospora]
MHSGRHKNNTLNKKTKCCLLALFSIPQFHSVLLSGASARSPGPSRLSRQYVELDLAENATHLADTKSSLEKDIAPLPADYCAMAAEASADSGGYIPHGVAKGCYEQFPFNATIRDQTILNVKANLKSFYVFYDIAKSPPPMENSDLEPVDLSAELDKIGNSSFPSDYNFHSTVSRLLTRLQDPHTSYKSLCYQQFLFIQPMSTYGVFENGRQQVKVATILNKLDNSLNKTLVDCEVTHIDGQPAFELMVEYAKTKAYSKDRSARLNKAFAHLLHDKTGGDHDRFALGAFAQRTSVPANATIEYRLDCSAKFEDLTEEEINGTPTMMTLELEWSALDSSMGTYTDGATYRQQFCGDESQQLTKKFILDTAEADDFSTLKSFMHTGQKKSKELYRGPYASFHLLSDGVTAVFRLGTESPNKQMLGWTHDEFYNNIDNGFASMENAGAKRLIVDLQNNSGGIICWGRYVLQTLFPQTDDSPYIYTLRASTLAQVLTEATFSYDQDILSPYAGLVDPKSGDEVSDPMWMTAADDLPGRQGLFSKRVTDRFCSAVSDLKDSDQDPMFDPEDIIILTNGNCGSTCAVLALQLRERYRVRTVTAGGHHGQSMAFISFPGGAVQTNNTQWSQRVAKVYNSLPASRRSKDLAAKIPKRLPANGQLTFTFRQVMSVDHPDQAEEYIRTPSDFRMDYTTARFRMPSILWDDVRRLVWDTDKNEEEEDLKSSKEEPTDDMMDGQAAVFGDGIIDTTEIVLGEEELEGEELESAAVEAGLRGNPM